MKKYKETDFDRDLAQKWLPLCPKCNVPIPCFCVEYQEARSVVISHFPKIKRYYRAIYHFFYICRRCNTIYSARY